MDETGEIVVFEWAMQPATADDFAPVLHSMGIEVERGAVGPRDNDERIYTLLEGAGLMFDQQQRSQLSDGATALLSGSASAETLGDALFRFAEEPGSGGAVVDLLSTPAQITEVRYISGEILVLADAEGARQLPVNPEAISSSLRRSLAGRPA